MNGNGAERSDVTLRIPGGSSFSNVTWVPLDYGKPEIARRVFVRIVSERDRAVLAAAPAVLVSFSAGEPVDVAAPVLELGGSVRRARLTPFGLQWMRVNWLISEGDTVRVRNEAHLSIVVQPEDGPPSCEIPDVPPLGDVCCVPVVMVRTPIGDDDGSRDMRWVTVQDVTLVLAADSAVSA